MKNNVSYGIQYHSPGRTVEWSTVSTTRTLEGAKERVRIYKENGSVQKYRIVKIVKTIVTRGHSWSPWEREA